jgi:hypothetical protein
MSFYGPVRTVAIIGALLLALDVWRLVHRASFDRQVGGPLGRVRRRGWYRREWKWWTFGAGLAGTQDGGLVLTSSRQVTGVPRLRGVHCESVMDWLEFRPLPGQTIELWQDACDRLAKSIGARQCSVTVDHDGVFLLGVVLDGHEWPASNGDAPTAVGGAR